MVMWFPLSEFLFIICLIQTINFAAAQQQLPDKEVYAKTIYAECRGEIIRGQQWVAWVIKNRARDNKSYWGGNTIKGVCLAPSQFQCWDGQTDIVINEQAVYNTIVQWSGQVFDLPNNQDPTDDAEYYNNPDIEGYPAWTKNVNKIQKIGNHQFYKSINPNPNKGPTLGNDKYMFAGDCLKSPSGQYKACLQPDGNFVVTQGANKVTWDSHTGSQGVPPYSLYMQPDNNLVLYDGNSAVNWKVPTSLKSNSPAVLSLQDDGNFVIYAGGKALWSIKNGMLV